MTNLDKLYEITRCGTKEELYQWLMHFSYYCGGFKTYKDIKEDFLNAECRYGTWIKDRSESWITPGGDPVWICGNCGGGQHVYGIESQDNYRDMCPECKCKMTYKI